MQMSENRMARQTIEHYWREGTDNCNCTNRLISYNRVHIMISMERVYYTWRFSFSSKGVFSEPVNEFSRLPKDIHIAAIFGALLKPWQFLNFILLLFLQVVVTQASEVPPRKPCGEKPSRRSLKRYFICCSEKKNNGERERSKREAHDLCRK